MEHDFLFLRLTDTLVLFSMDKGSEFTFGEISKLTSHCKCLGKAVDCHGALPHAGQRCKACVSGRRVNDVLVDLV